MIKIIRVRQPDKESIEAMVPHFTLQEESRPAFVEDTLRALASTPDAINIVQSWREESLVGFVIGFSDPRQPYIWIAQAWSDSQNGRRVADEMFLRMFLWAIALGKDSLRAETSREIGPFFRRFGFQPITTVIEYQITKETSSMLFEQGREVLKNGRTLRVKNEDRSGLDALSDAAGLTRPSV